MWTNLVRGLGDLGSVSAVAYLFLGSLTGMFIGVIPGLGGVVILTIILAFVYHLDLTATLCLFLGVQAGSYFSASVTSILLNAPAHPEAFAVTLDGFPMAQRGQAGRALGISAASTCIGGIVGCVVLVAFIPLINYFPLIFHPPEYAALVFIALLLVGTLGTDAVSKGLISAGLGLMISTVGPDPFTGAFRYTFGSEGLINGISLVALALGLFAVPQMTLIFGMASTIARQDMLGRAVESSVPVELERGFGKQVIGGIRETMRHGRLLVQSGLVGVVTGIVPGIGGFAANFLSYGIAQQTSRRRDRYGTGIAEGIVAPEGSSLAKEAGSMIPILGLAVPGGVGGALLLAALVIKGIQTGYGLTSLYPTMPYEMVWIIALSGIIGTSAGVLAAPWLAKVTKVPGPVLVPFILCLAVVGTYVADVSFFSVIEMLVFSVVGLVLRRLRYSVASFVIGLVLGPTLEPNLHLTHTVYPGFSFLGRPLADVLFAIAIAILILKAIQFRRSAARAKAAVTADGPADRLRQELLLHPNPLLAPITTAFIAALAIAFTVYGSTHYAFTPALMPVMAGGIVALASLWRLPVEVRVYLRYRALARQLRPGAAAREGSEGGGQDTACPYPGGTAQENVRLGRDVQLPVGPVASMSPGPMEADGVEVPGQVAVEVRQAAASRLPELREKTWGWHGQYTREMVAVGWLVGLVAVSWLLGLTVSVPLFCVAYGLTATRRVFRRWISRAVFAIVSAAAMWVIVFEIQQILYVSLPPKLTLF
jgi:putative tricarboxylic transport membrane protein